MKTTAVIRKEGNKYVIYSKTGKKLGTYNSRKEAEERLRQIEYFKHTRSNLLIDWASRLIDN